METAHNLIFLIGYRGVGKTTVGRRLADALGYDFVDTDLAITRLKKTTISDIVANEGWYGFRSCEEEVLRSTKKLRKTVVATGGGAVLHLREWQDLRKISFVFWLSADEDIILSRIGKDQMSSLQRPSLTSASAADELGSVLKERIPLYRRIAHIQIDTGRLSIGETVAMMRELILKKSTE